MTAAVSRLGNRQFAGMLMALLIASSLGRGSTRADEPEKAKDVPEQIVDTMNAIFGKHPGFRSAHAKGIVCEGEFTPAATAADAVEGAPPPGQAGASDRPVLGQHRHPGRARRRPAMPTRTAWPSASTCRTGAAPTSSPTPSTASRSSTAEDFLALLKRCAESGPDAPKPTPLEKFLAHAPQGDEGRDGPEADPGQLRDRALFRGQRLPLHQPRGQDPLTAATSSARRPVRNS